MKKRLNGGRVAIAGLIVGILIAIISFIIGYIDYDPTNPNYTLELYMNPWAFVGGVVAEGIITMVAFIVLYAITKPVYNKLRKT